MKTTKQLHRKILAGKATRREIIDAIRETVASRYVMEVRMSARQTLAVRSLTEARDSFQEFIRLNDLASSDLSRYAGDVTKQGQKVAHISYNGRVWTAEPWPNCTEILLDEQEVSA
jgi:hypothetical protein